MKEPLYAALYLFRSVVSRSSEWCIRRLQWDWSSDNAIVGDHCNNALRWQGTHGDTSYGVDFGCITGEHSSKTVAPAWDEPDWLCFPWGESTDQIFAPNKQSWKLLQCLGSKLERSCKNRCHFGMRLILYDIDYVKFKFSNFILYWMNWRPVKPLASRQPSGLNLPNPQQSKVSLV